MTLAQRLLLAIGSLTLVSAALLALGVRQAWRESEEERFNAAFTLATDRLGREITTSIEQLPGLIEPLCQHDPTVDRALIGLKKRQIDPATRLALQEHVEELARAHGLDELTLLSGEGEILGSTDAARLGARDPDLARALAPRPREAWVRATPVPALMAQCLKRDARSPDVWLGFSAARHVEPLLASISDVAGVTLVLGEAAPRSDRLARGVPVPKLKGLSISASQSRVPLTHALRSLDRVVLALGAATFMLALVVATLLSRSLARPMVELSEQARRVVAGDPQPVRASGGKELVEFAEAFNAAISDLTALRKRLAATERIAARREIARRVAHEIKNPLAPIRAAVETLRRLQARRDPAFDEYFDEATRTVLEEVARINAIVTEFTRFQRLAPPAPAPVDVVETARKVVNLHAGADPRLSLHAEPCAVINADADQLVQVLTNLVQNALDAIGTDAERRVTVSLRQPDAAHVVVRVEDDGPGVPAEIREKLFEPYATTKPQGTGLGLAIVQRIAIEHGGEITYRDRPEGGACFELRLPVSGPTLLAEPPTLTGT